MSDVATLPDPLVPAEVDLNGYEFMPLYGERLRTSDQNSGCTDAEFRASINLWWSAWMQVPAGSLPADDVSLCRLADLGRDLKAWRKVKASAMRNFVLCSDGRMYHTFLAPLVLEAWAARVKARLKGKNGALKRWGNKPGPVDNHGRAIETGCPGHKETMPQPSIQDATAIENHSKGEESLSRNNSPRGGTGVRAATAYPPGSETRKGNPTAAARTTREASVVSEGHRKGLTARPGESLEDFEARVRTARP